MPVAQWRNKKFQSTPTLLLFVGLLSLLLFAIELRRSMSLFPGLSTHDDVAIVNNVQRYFTMDYTTRIQRRDHVIPRVLIFTHFINLLEYDVDYNHTAPATTKIEHDLSRAEKNEIRSLQANIRKTISLHPNATVRFLTDVDCETSIGNALGNQTRLVEYFRREPRGMYKSDICRGAALYETGGLYFDVDLGLRMPVWSLLGEHTTFATVKVHERSKQKPGFFQAFIASTPRHPILKRYLELFVKYYDGDLKLETKKLEESKQMLGVRILAEAYNAIMEEQRLAEERRLDGLLGGAMSPPGTTVGAVELWQEVMYSPEKFPNIPPPPSESEESCKFLVVANHGSPPVVPFYSRVQGSRMCP